MSPVRSHIRWFLIFWMFVISAVSFLDRVNWSIAVLPIEQTFHLTDIQFGWVFSAWALGYALFQAPSGYLADRIGPRKTLAFGTVWWAIFTGLTALVPSGLSGSLLLLMAVRFLLGAGEAVAYPASNRLVASWIPAQERGLANGFIFAGVGVGAGITPRLITFVIVNYGWQWAFWVSALIGLFAGMIWFFVSRDKPQEHPWIAPEEIAYIRAGLPPSTVAATRQSFPWRGIFTNSSVIALTASYFCYGYTAYIFFAWFFKYLSQVRGLNLKASSYYAMLPFIAMAICSPLGGWISDIVAKRSGESAGRCGVACGSMALAAVFVAMGTRAADVRVASIVLAGGAGALYLSQSAFWSLSSRLGGRASGSLSGVMNTGNQIGGAITASLTPLIAKYFGWGVSFFVAAGLCAVGALLWLAVDPDQQLFGTDGSPLESFEMVSGGTQ
jgi:ACS family glucarate transporter-like MFS transporter